MNKPSDFLAAVLCILATSLFGQSTPAAQDLTYTISTAQPWTDTGLDLLAGDSLQISASATASGLPDDHSVSGGANCSPSGSAAGGANGNSPTQARLPLVSAPAGALIARLHAHGAMPVLIGAGRQLHIDQSSHLYLGVNVADAPPCQASFTVRVHLSPAGSASGAIPTSESLTPSSNTTKPQSSSSVAAAAASPAPASGEAQRESRSETLKSQLSTAAQIFMSGQFGSGKSETNPSEGSNAASGSTSGAEASPAPALKISDTPLDSDLRTSLDSLPRRVNDQYRNLGDMVNFVIVGPQKEVQAALDAANWHVADTTKQSAVLSAVMETYQNKDYLQMPMSTLYLFGRAQDYGYEQAEPIAMVASRHHFRIWKASFTWKGQEVWVGAGTHDVGFAKDKRNGSVTHKIDPAVDGERDNIGGSLQKGGKVKSLTYYLPPSPVQDARNATGDGYHSDGRLLVILLQ